MTTPGLEDAPRALKGLVVLDIGHWLAGPFGATLLADFGAEVIKVEPPGGQRTPMTGAISWSVEARNKKCITLALNTPRGQELFKRLVRHADVVVENFKPGTLEKWGLDYAALAAENERIILTRVSGFGQTGPYRDRLSFDRLGIAMGGLTYTTGYTDRPPVRPGFMVADYGSGLMNAFATLLAVYNRDIAGTGKGQEVDVSLFETVFRLSGPLLSSFDKLGNIRERSDNLVPGISPGDQFETKDGAWIVIHAGADHHFVRLFETIGLPEIAHDPAYATLAQRIPAVEPLNALVGAWVAERTAAEVIETLVEAGVAAAKVYSAADIVADPHYAAREDIVTVDDPVVGPIKQPAPIPKLSRTPGRIYRAAPAKGEHNAEIYGGWLGLDEGCLAELRDAGII
jgi:crotonobetainyl-CoA:carnitine CoA-transferase CaiB-like acyl-CoA transferase